VSDSTQNAGTQEDGGNGGTGGAGSGGAGGWSCAIVVDDAGAANVFDGGTLVIGGGGSGAPDGQAAPVCHTR
jgi:hypothetical protein